MKLKIYLMFLWVLVACMACNKKNINTIDITSPKIYTYCHKLTAVSSDKDGYWIGDENGDICLVKGMKHQLYRTGLDKIYDVMRDAHDSTMLWIASRNSGLQKWKLQDDTLSLSHTYNIQDKGTHYSPYNIRVVHGHMLVATSQGLFEVPSSDTCQMLHPQYPLHQASYRHASPITHLAVIGDRYVYAKTQGGLLRYDAVKQKSEMLHPKVDFRNVYATKDTLYLIADNKLVLLGPKGTKQKEYLFNFKITNYCRHGNTSIFLTPSEAYLTNDMTNFKKVDLWDETIAQAYNTIIPDDGLGYFVIIAGANERRLPHHFDAIGNGSNLQFMAYSGKYIYMTNKSGKIYREEMGQKDATEVYQLSSEQYPVAFSAIDNTLFFVTVTNHLYRLKLHNSFWVNQLLSAPQDLFEIRTHVTAMTALPSQQKVLIGIQDELLRLDAVTDHVDTIKAMHGKYITSFYTVPGTTDTYISTLNDGVFYYSAGVLHKIDNIKDMSFINNIAVTKGYNPSMFLLDNHYVTVLGGNRITAQGHKKMFLINDSLLFTLSEQGIVSYSIDKSHLQRQKLLYSDIRFEPSACINVNDKLYLGANLGVVVIHPEKKYGTYWIDFNDHKIGIWTILAGIIGLGILLGIYYMARRSKQLAESNQLRLQMEDLQKRFKGLNMMVSELNDTEAQRVYEFKRELQQVDMNAPNRKKEYQRLSQLSAELARLNQDVVLQIIKAQEKQLENIKNLNCIEGAQIIERTEKVLGTGEVERIIAQYGINKNWLNRVIDFKTKMQFLEAKLKDALVLNGVNEELVAHIARWKEELHHKTVDEMELYSKEATRLYDDLFSKKALTLIMDYLDKRKRFLQKQKTYAHMASILLIKLDELTKKATDTDRASLLCQLRPLELRMQQMGTLHRLRKLMRAFAEGEDSKENVDHIQQLIATFFEISQRIDKMAIEDILHFTSCTSQQVKVLIILLADKNVKRSLIPGMLGIYGNLNPVISRLYHGKIGENIEALRNYDQQSPESIVFYILQLIEL